MVQVKPPPPHSLAISLKFFDCSATSLSLPWNSSNSSGVSGSYYYNCGYDYNHYIVNTSDANGSYQIDLYSVENVALYGGSGNDNSSYSGTGSYQVNSGGAGGTSYTGSGTNTESGSDASTYSFNVSLQINNGIWMAQSGSGSQTDNSAGNTTYAAGGNYSYAITGGSVSGTWTNVPHGTFIGGDSYERVKTTDIPKRLYPRSCGRAAIVLPHAYNSMHC